MSAPTLSDLLAVVRVDDNLSQDLAYIVCLDIAQKYPQKSEDLQGAVDELTRGGEGSDFWISFRTEDRAALYKLCNRYLDRVRIRNARSDALRQAHESVTLDGTLPLSAQTHGPLEELEWADEVEHLERDAWAWFATLKKPKERAALALMIEHYDPNHPRAATHYSDRDVNAATGLTRPRIAELRAELIRLADLWITSDPPEQTPTHYTADATKVKEPLALAPGGKYTAEQSTETALPSKQRPKNYDPDNATWFDEPDPISGPGSALGDVYYKLDTLMLQSMRRLATPAEKAEVRAAKDAVDQRVGVKLDKRGIAPKFDNTKVRLDAAGLAELKRRW